MNGLKCYLTREQVKQLIQTEIEKKLDPRQLLGECTVDVALCEDGRVEITYWKCDAEDSEAPHIEVASIRPGSKESPKSQSPKSQGEVTRLAVNSPSGQAPRSMNEVSQEA